MFRFPSEFELEVSSAKRLLSLELFQLIFLKEKFPFGIKNSRGQFIPRCTSTRGIINLIWSKINPFHGRTFSEASVSVRVYNISRQ